jgi:hypothetical protein
VGALEPFNDAKPAASAAASSAIRSADVRLMGGTVEGHHEQAMKRVCHLPFTQSSAAFA